MTRVFGHENVHFLFLDRAILYPDYYSFCGDFFKDINFFFTLTL